MTTEKQDVYTRITNTIIASLEQGVRPWIQPWSNGKADARIMRPLRHNGQPYSGINVLMLWASAAAQGFTSPFWMTFNQALELDAHVRKGAKGSLIVYANRITRTEKTDDGGEVEREIPFLKGYTVFNTEQIEGLPESFRMEPAPPPSRVERIAHADRFFANTGLTIRHGGDRAFYSESADYVQMPPVESFTDTLSYYSTLSHEAVHATKASHRLNRDFGRKTWGDKAYAREELVAELGSAFLCADLGLTPEVRDDHAAYIGSWLKILENDTRAVFSAAAHAQRAVDHLSSIPSPEQPQCGSSVSLERGNIPFNR